jgi:hypothetical protein
MLPCREKGLQAEDYFIEKIKPFFPDYNYVDDFYDFELDGTKVEVKSCLFRSRNGRARPKSNQDYFHIFGRFDFTKAETRDKLIEEGVWIAFIVRSHDDFLLLGFVESKNLKIKRYVRMIDVMRVKPLSIDQFRQHIKRKEIIEIK